MVPDTWVGNHPFKDFYPVLYNTTNHPHDTVANIMRSTPLNISFRRALVGDKLDEWEDLVAKITHINLTDERDLFIWILHNSGHFTACSMYLDKMNQNTPFSHKLIGS